MFTPAVEVQVIITKFMMFSVLLQPKTKRRFIDKKNAVTFHLVHRSQHDPLITDETAPQHVLVESTTQGILNQKKEARM